MARTFTPDAQSDMSKVEAIATVVRISEEHDKDWGTVREIVERCQTCPTSEIPRVLADMDRQLAAIRSKTQRIQVACGHATGAAILRDRAMPSAAR